MSTFLFVVVCSCFYHVEIAQKKEISLAEIRFGKSKTAVKGMKVAYPIASNGRIAGKLKNR